MLIFISLFVVIRKLGVLDKKGVPLLTMRAAHVLFVSFALEAGVEKSFEQYYKHPFWYDALCDVIAYARAPA